MTGRANRTDHITLSHTLTASDIDRAQMSIERLEIIPMIDHDHVAIPIVVPTGIYDHACIRCIHGFAQVACNIDAQVICAWGVIKS